MLEYLIKLVMFTCSLYNMNGYKVFEYLLMGVMPKIFTTSQREYLTQRIQPFMLQEGVLYNLDKITSFVKFCN
jgi:hypothetical protein